MEQRLWLIGFFTLLVGGLWLGCMCMTPHRGVLKMTEKLCAGLILCYCLAAALAPFGLRMDYGPVASAFAGAMGLPGALLSFLVGGGLS
ncbi:MAG: hypothetical protein PHI98_01455 [Eubacteriales bacterium]|nr:hypothetical protein [Eubacteriales bacterium]